MSSSTADIRPMAREDGPKRPWWELPAESPGAPDYVREREQFRAELARAWRARGIERDRSQAHVSSDSRPRPAA